MSVAEFFLGPDGGADEMAALMVLAVLVFLGLEVYSVVAKGSPFDPQAFGTGLGLAVGAGASGMGLKARLERKEGDH